MKTVNSDFYRRVDTLDVMDLMYMETKDVIMVKCTSSRMVLNIALCLQQDTANIIEVLLRKKRRIIIGRDLIVRKKNRVIETLHIKLGIGFNPH